MAYEGSLHIGSQAQLVAVTLGNGSYHSAERMHGGPFVAMRMECSGGVKGVFRYRQQGGGDCMAGSDFVVRQDDARLVQVFPSLPSHESKSFYGRDML